MINILKKMSSKQANFDDGTSFQNNQYTINCFLGGGSFAKHYKVKNNKSSQE
jgi:hypothetical protein